MTATGAFKSTSRDRLRVPSSSSWRRICKARLSSERMMKRRRREHDDEVDPGVRQQRVDAHRHAAILRRPRFGGMGVDIGEAGHINVASGFGRWAAGYDFLELLKERSALGAAENGRLFSPAVAGGGLSLN